MATYLDLESEGDRARLTEPELYFADHADELLVLDEIQRLPGLFEVLRGVIDRGRREGRGDGRFLLLGSASLELLAQSGESLAGRIAFAELAPFDLTRSALRGWTRSGFEVASRRASSRATTRPACAGGATSSAPTWSATSPSSAPGSRRRPCDDCGRCWPTTGCLLNAATIARGLGVGGTASTAISTSWWICSWSAVSRRDSPTPASAWCDRPRPTYATAACSMRCSGSPTRSRFWATQSSGAAGRGWRSRT